MLDGDATRESLNRLAAAIEKDSASVMLEGPTGPVGPSGPTGGPCGERGPVGQFNPEIWTEFERHRKEIPADELAAKMREAMATTTFTPPPAEVTIRLEKDGSVSIFGHEVIEGWCRVHGKSLEIKLSDIPPADSVLMIGGDHSIHEFPGWKNETLDQLPEPDAIVPTSK